MVAGQALEGGAWPVRTREPAVPSLSLLRTLNGSHYFVLLTGADYGPGVGGGEGCAAANVNVTVDFVPCDALTMRQVRIFVFGGRDGGRGQAGDSVALWPGLQGPPFHFWSIVLGGGGSR